MTTATTMAEAIEGIWEANRAEMARRIATVEAAVCALRSGDLDGELQARAIADAHKLAGSLGMFGLGAGSEIAHKLELALETGPDPRELPRLGKLAALLRAGFDDRPSGRRTADAQPDRPTPPARS